MKKVFFLTLVLISTALFSQKKDTIQPGNQLEGVIAIAKDPIAKKFSVEKLSKMDIYFNPASNADPLKAISILPSSTNVEETANPTLRGGSPDRSRVYLNGAPVVNPVRFGRDNGLGNFSLFNTEIIDKQYVYASNPPLTFGNSSAGLVQIETNHKLNYESLQFSLALSNVGIMVNKKISKNKKDNFIQAYANYQFDKPFIELNKNSFPNLNDFSTADIGLNSHFKFTDNLSFNSFNYFINEAYSVTSQTLNFSSGAIAKKKRFFSINNVDFSTGKTSIRYSTMFDYGNSGFNYGNINSKVQSYQYFNSLNAKSKLSRSFIAQYGMESCVFKNNYDEHIPLFYYALTPNSPTTTNTKNVDFYYVEPYLYLNYEFSNNFGISSAVRKNVFLDKGISSFISYQLSSHYKLNYKNRFILSGGKYHSYSNPNYYVRNYALLSSDQVALDYYFESRKLSLSSAIYYKSDKGNFTLNDFERYDRIKTFGIEFSLAFPFAKHFKINASNAYVSQKQFISEEEYNTALNLNYFVKAQLMYNNPTLFNCSLLFSTRPGNHYTAFNNAKFNNNAHDFQPRFSTPFSSTFSNYKRFDFTISKLLPLKKSYMTLFASVNNIFDFKNQESVYYDKDYLNRQFNYYQRRILYFGLQLRL